MSEVNGGGSRSPTHASQELNVGRGSDQTMYFVLWARGAPKTMQHAKHRTVPHTLAWYFGLEAALTYKQTST